MLLEFDVEFEYDDGDRDPVVNGFEAHQFIVHARTLLLDNPMPASTLRPQDGKLRVTTVPEPFVRPS